MKNKDGRVKQPDLTKFLNEKLEKEAEKIGTTKGEVVQNIFDKLHEGEEIDNRTLH